MCLSQVNEAEEERLCSEREHMRVTHACQEAEARVQMLQKSLKRVIVKSKPYFELKAQFNHILEVMQPSSASVCESWSMDCTRCCVQCLLSSVTPSFVICLYSCVAVIYSVYYGFTRGHWWAVA